MRLIFPLLLLTYWVSPFPVVSDDNLTNLPPLMIETVAHFLDPKDQISLYGTHSTIKDVLKDQFLMKAKAFNQTCPRWLIRKAFGNVWSIFTTDTLSQPNSNYVSLGCLQLMNTHIDMLKQVKTLKLFLIDVTTDYLDALGDLLSNKDFTRVRIANFQETFPIEYLFRILRNARIETLELYITHTVPTSDAFENLALNKNIKHLDINKKLFPLFIEVAQKFPNLESIECDIDEPLNQTSITKLYQSRSLSSVFLPRQSIIDQQTLMSIDSPFSSFSIKIDGSENAIIEKPLINLKLDLACSDCQSVVLNLENSFRTLVALEITQHRVFGGLNSPFLSTLFQQSKALDSLTINVMKASEITDLLPFSLDLKTLSVLFWEQSQMDFGPLLEFISKQDHLEHFHIYLTTNFVYEDTETILIPLLMALQSRNQLKTIMIDFEKGITTIEMDGFVPLFKGAVSRFKDKNILINGIRVKDIMERMKGDRIPKDTLRTPSYMVV